MARRALSGSVAAAIGSVRTRTHEGLAAIVGCDVHLLDNVECSRRSGDDDAAIDHWCGTRIESGSGAFDALIAGKGAQGDSSFDDRPALADADLVSQIQSARRFKVDIGRWLRSQRRPRPPTKGLAAHRNV